MNFFAVLALALVCMCSSLAAADVAGKWRAEFTSPDGTQRVNTFNFKTKGAVLEGTVAGGQDETPIQDGKINGDEISFRAERPFGLFTYAGKIDGKEMKLKVTFNDQEMNITAKRIPD